MVKAGRLHPGLGNGLTKRNERLVSVFCGTSVDGFIAREDGDVKWLEAGSQKGVDYGFTPFFKSVDALVMGRGTFDKMITFDKWYYGKKPIIVLTHRPESVPKKVPKTVEFMQGTPHQIVDRLAERGLHRLYVDGGKTIQAFLAAGLVDEITVSQVPVLIGSGIPLFGPLPDDIVLELVKTRSYPGGMVQTKYRLKRDGAPEATSRRRSRSARRPARARSR